MGGAGRLFSGAHTAFSALLVHSEVSAGVSGPVCLPPHRFSQLFGVSLHSPQP